MRINHYRLSCKKVLFCKQLKTMPYSDVLFLEEMNHSLQTAIAQEEPLLQTIHKPSFNDINLDRRTSRAIVSCNAELFKSSKRYLHSLKNATILSLSGNTSCKYLRKILQGILFLNLTTLTKRF